MTLNYNISVNTSEAEHDLKLLGSVILDEAHVAIKNSVDKIKNTVISEYSVGGGRGFTTRTGRLRSSITSWLEEGLNHVTGIVSAGVDYDIYVELLWGGKYAYMLPSLIDNIDNIIKEIEDSVNRATRRL